MNIFKTAIILSITATLSCVHSTKPDQNEQKQVLTTGKCFVYSINEITNDPVIGTDSILGVMVLRVEGTDSIRNLPVHRVKNQTRYFLGRTATLDSTFASYDYIYESDSFLISLAFHDIGNTGLLMKRQLVSPTDSVTRNGDSAKIENEDDKYFTKVPSVGFTWTQRPDWLQYSITGKEPASAWGKTYSCFKITATPLDSNPSTYDSTAYDQVSWVTPTFIVKTEIHAGPFPAGFVIQSYYGISLIEIIGNAATAPDPEAYKARIVGKGFGG